MLSKNVSACVLALSLTTVAATSVSAGTYDLGTLTSSYSYSEVIDHETSKSRLAGAEGMKSYSDLADRGSAFDVDGKGEGWFGDLYKHNLAGTLSPPVQEPATIAMLLAGLGLVLTTARRRTVNR